MTHDRRRSMGLSGSNVPASLLRDLAALGMLMRTTTPARSRLERALGSDLTGRILETTARQA